MNRRWIALMMVLILVLSACSGGEQTVAQPAVEEATEAPEATATATAIPPTATAAPPTAKPDPPTSTPEPPTPTPMPVEVVEDVPYIDDGIPEHTSDIYLPAEVEGPYPTVVIYHSGVFWYRGEIRHAEAYDALARYFAGRGYAVVVPSYRVSETDPYPAAVEDAFCSVAWVHAEAAQYGFDIDRVAALGWEAGADLASLVGTVDERERFVENCPHALPEEPWVRSVVAIGGFYHLPSLFDRMDPGVQNYIVHYLQAMPEEAPERYAEASPITWVDGSEPPFAVIYNRCQIYVDFRERALEFADTLEAAGSSAEVIELSMDLYPSFPQPDSQAELRPGWQPSWEVYGVPQAESYLAEQFGIDD
ncbi:MAG: alpha/beta hydrolase fold domain-containing protein [Anaerolineae bacterium]